MAAKKLALKYVPVGSIHPNPWNPNEMNEATYQAERESIREYGFVDPTLVRAHPDLPGEWQVIDGEHRTRAAEDEGYDEVPIIVLPPGFTDTQVKKLTVILNETRGEADLVALARLLDEIGADGGDDPFAGLPYSDSDLKHFRELAAVNWDDLDATPPPLPDPKDDPDAEWWTLTARLPRDVQPVWDAALEKAAAAGVDHDDPFVRAGQVIELLCADFLASR